MRQLFILIVLTTQIIPSAFSQKSDTKIKLVVQPDTSLYHTPMNIAASGFKSGQRVMFQVNAKDAEGNIWKSNAVFAADDLGLVDPSKSKSIDGSYTGIHPMGLFWSMKSNDDHQIATGKGFSATVDVLLNNKIVASKTIYRRSTRELESLNIKGIEIRDSVIANYYLPHSKKSFLQSFFLVDLVDNSDKNDLPYLQAKDLLF